VLPGRRYTPSDVVFLLVKFKWLIILPALVLGIVAVLYARTLPDLYTSQTVLQVVAPRVPRNIVQSTVTTGIEERLPAITQQILSRTRLERIIQDFGLYAEERQTELMEDVVQTMRSRINVGLDRGDAFRVSFVSEDPRQAMRVAERLASLFVEENLRDREVLAEGTNQFLDSQLDEARRRLLEHERRLEEYRRQWRGELPSQLQTNLQALQSLQSRYGQLAESINRDRDRHLVLERMLADLTAEAVAAENPDPDEGPAPTLGLDLAGDVPTIPPGSAARQLEMARLQIEAMLLRLKPEHPDIARANRILQELERKAEEEAAQRPVSIAGKPAPEDPAVALRENKMHAIRNEMENIERQIEQKREDQARAQAQIAEFDRRVDATPTRESEMIALNRDYATLQGMYTALLQKGEDAKIAANLERRQIGEQFKVIDAARVPERPFSPDRTLYNFGGFAVGLALGLGFIVLMEVKDSSFRTDDDVVGVLSLPVLATVPAIYTRAERRSMRKRNRLLAAAGALMVLGAVGAALVYKAGYLDRWL